GLLRPDPLDDDRTLKAGVARDVLARLGERLADDVDADGLVTFGLHLVQGGDDVDQGGTAAGNDALFDGRAGRVDGVLDAVLLLLELRLGGRAHLDDGDAASQFGKTLLKLLPIGVRIGLLDLPLDELDAALDGLFVAAALDDGRLLFRHAHATSLAQHVEGDVFELGAKILGDELAAGEDCDVLEHGLAPLTEAGSLDGRDVEDALDTVDDQGGQRLSFDVLSDDEE